MHSLPLLSRFDERSTILLARHYNSSLCCAGSRLIINVARSLYLRPHTRVLCISGLGAADLQTSYGNFSISLVPPWIFSAALFFARVYHPQYRVRLYTVNVAPDWDAVPCQEPLSYIVHFIYVASAFVYISPVQVNHPTFAVPSRSTLRLHGACLFI